MNLKFVLIKNEKNYLRLIKIRMFRLINKISQLIKRDKSPKRFFSEIENNNLREETEPIRKKLKILLDRSKINHKDEILKQDTLKEAHVYCKMNNLTGQESGPLIETYIKNKYDMQKNKPSECLGDLNSKSKNIEIKISNGGKNNDKFNYVQLRMNHNCDYIFTAYYLDYTNLDQTGELFIFYLNIIKRCTTWRDSKSDTDKFNCCNWLQFNFTVKFISINRFWSIKSIIHYNLKTK